ncbi:MAG: hypothetical protein K2G33_03310 [Duncaniella sp.]|nr:hypothetical protein [Duncaniella sp.]
MIYRVLTVLYILAASVLYAAAQPAVINIDPNFSRQETAGDSTRYTSLKEALLAAERWQKIHSYSENNPLTIRIAPSVYWLDDPDGTEIRNPKPGSNIPFGMELELSHLKLIGLCENPEDVVIACNRGQTQGANGNFTMMHLTGNDITAENITFGNYCNVDLVYPRDTSLNRSKREDAIVQAQLIICDGDRITARNCRFISRLNLCPFAGAKRVLFENCYFECTDDALCGTGVYLGCRFKLFSGKPFYNTYAQGARLIDCDIHTLTSGRQYLVKVGSQVAMVDCRWSSDDPELYIGWTQDATDDLRSYQYNVSLNGRKITVDSMRPKVTVDMDGKPLLKAYKAGDTYNIYNLLKGSDRWNPTAQDTTALPSLPTMLTLSHRKAEIETGKDSLVIRADLPGVTWSVGEDDKESLAIGTLPDGSCLIKGINIREEAHTANLLASTPEGLEAACVVKVNPPTLPAPEFTTRPGLMRRGDTLRVEYFIDIAGRPDRSLVTWYRSTKSDGSDAIPVAVTRGDKPGKSYILSEADNGHYISAKVEPRHNRSHTGKAVSVITTKKVNVVAPQMHLETDFTDFPTVCQPDIRPGFWTVDAFKPTDTSGYDWIPDTTHGWSYGEGVDGAAGVHGLTQSSRGARLMYTPPASSYGDMEVNLTANPCKSAGQGFGSATGQYMDIYIKFDPSTLTGYALRIIRTPKNDKAVDFLLMRYDNGTATPICEPVSAVCYRRGCKINLSADGDRLTATVSSDNTPEPHRPELAKSVRLTAAISPNTFGGTGIQHTGSTGASATILSHMKIDWK